MQKKKKQRQNEQDGEKIQEKMIHTKHINGICGHNFRFPNV